MKIPYFEHYIKDVSPCVSACVCLINSFYRLLLPVSGFLIQ